MKIKGKCGHTWDGGLRRAGYTCPVCGDETVLKEGKYINHQVPDGYRIADREDAKRSADVLTQNYSGEWVKCSQVVYNRETIQAYAVRV